MRNYFVGRKSKRKKLHQASPVQQKFVQRASNGFARRSTAPGFARFLVEIIRWGACIALFAPLIVHPAFFFPFVVPKTVFFWIFTEIITAAWILLAISNKQFRPRWNILTVFFAVFIFVTILTSFTGINIERSFWSTFERMAGTINWIHLALFFFVLSSTFKTPKEWRRLLTVSFVVALFVAIIFLFQRMGISIISFNTKGGSTIGNSSFMAAYLLFNIFFGLWLFVNSLKNCSKKYPQGMWQVVFYGIVLGLLIFAVRVSTAYGALLSMFGGGFIVLLAWLFFSNRIKLLRMAAVLFLIGGIFVGSIVVWGTLTQNEAITGKLPYFFSNRGTIGARKVVWDMAWQGVKERPILGWGPENFNVVFTKYFNPCLPLPECGSEVWFDRTHNTVLDNLINSGIVGFLSYLSLFVGALFLIWRNFWRNKNDLFLPSVVTAALASYFAQNLLVFDMMNTYLMFSFTLAFVAGITSGSEDHEEKLRDPKAISTIFIGLLLAYYLFSFGAQSLQAANWGIEISRGGLSAEETIVLYKKGLSVSSLGNRQIPEFFTNKVTNGLISDVELPSEFVIGVGDIMAKTLEKNPIDFRHYILLGSFYNVARDHSPDYLDKAEEILKKAVDLSPTNQQAYTSLGQTYVFKGEFESAINALKKARDLEPRYGRPYQALGEAYKLAGEDELAEESFKRAEELGYKPKR